LSFSTESLPFLLWEQPGSGNYSHENTQQGLALCVALRAESEGRRQPLKMKFSTIMQKPLIWTTLLAAFQFLFATASAAQMTRITESRVLNANAGLKWTPKTGQSDKVE